MAVNKKAQIRYLTLDRCLRNSGRKWSWKDLLEAVNNVLSNEINTKTGLPMKIGKTQLFEDLKDMEYRVYDAPIEFRTEGRTRYYYYSDKNYSIQNAPISDTEASQLEATFLLLSRFSGLPEFQFINDVIPALQTKLSIVKTDAQVIAFENNYDYEGSKYLTGIFNAIVNRRAVRIEYQDFKVRESYTLLFHPHYLKQYNNRWFAFGYNEQKKAAKWNIALDRIKKIEEINVKYVSSDIIWEEYFEDMIGVTRKPDQKSITIKLLFSKEQAPYVITKPLHLTQKHRFVKDKLEVRICVIPNYELEKLILSFGESVTVVSPITLRKAIYNRLIKGVTLYSSL